ncbi:hypothetical protein THAOC_01491 [Thalassiosira oceanica]|uniref:EF-hand domain-containing protein n=1 Tax=Thalassiosira oceanica TaxID=159749 RepID=K0TQW0_THAOC|nr:hypothetical protein THAOC_01491 [Thalassiosira oceanica]|eukprot:EJK76732.1 hypothetical protein THAOC_01491 [Thalassiosira oceanica]
MVELIGAISCQPASKEYVSEIFELLDTDNSGTLSKDEFRTVMKILYSQSVVAVPLAYARLDGQGRVNSLRRSLQSAISEHGADSTDRGADVIGTAGGAEQGGRSG